MKDAILEARKNKDFPKYSQDADVKIRLAQQVYDKRIELNLSQTELAKKCYTTQRIISGVENADINIGICLFARLNNALNLDSGFILSSFIPLLGGCSLKIEVNNEKTGQNYQPQEMVRSQKV